MLLCWGPHAEEKRGDISATHSVVRAHHSHGGNGLVMQLQKRVTEHSKLSHQLLLMQQALEEHKIDMQFENFLPSHSSKGSHLKKTAEPFLSPQKSNYGEVSSCDVMTCAHTFLHTCMCAPIFLIYVCRHTHTHTATVYASFFKYGDISKPSSGICA